ncbi:MAG: ECF-type riboflavin transporter substrate-binding protein [Chloroflexota bacterium]
MFKFKTKELVATAIGAALFTILFMYVKFPTPVANTQFTTSYGLGAFFAVLFGPIAGALIAFIGHALGDTFLWGSAWWSWVIASGVAGFGFGLAKKRINIESGVFGSKEIITFNVVQTLAHLVAFGLVAPVLDILIYSEPVNLVFTQGLVAFLGNAVSTGVIGTILLMVYAKTRTQEGSLE